MAEEKRKPTDRRVRVEGAGGDPTDVVGPRRAQTNLGVGDDRTGEIGTKVVGAEGTGDTIDMRDFGAGAGGSALTGNTDGRLGLDTGSMGSPAVGEVLDGGVGIGTNTRANTIRDDEKDSRDTADREKDAA
jgi:hypothetical protein